MRKALTVITLISSSLLLMSWSVTGHKTVAQIAENHLSARANSCIKLLAGKHSLGSVSSWADEVKNQPQYKNTGPWHYISVPPNLGFAAFERAVKNDKADNIYNALLKNEAILTAATSDLQARSTALKFIVHLVGDIHQPMHVTRIGADRGGNNIQLQYDGKGTNLHQVYDSGLLNHQAVPYQDLAAKLDNGTSPKPTLTDPVMHWLFESYQISNKVYAEVGSKKTLTDAYYQSHIAVVNQRLQLAGLRLANLLNGLFAAPVYNHQLPASPIPEVKTAGEVRAININNVADYVGYKADVSGKVYGYKSFPGLVLVDLGAPYPNQKLTLVLKGNAITLASLINGKQITVTGMLKKRKGKMEIVINDKANLRVAK
ncbi:hypothetical protein A0256_15545 [Mucilaginibacter sp. PAMC 26640]|nr:hypothetical protein A0256_15545 [Mucilaginibacter sp. PAMC 26640]